MANVTLRDVTKAYPGGVKAVDRLSMVIGDHELVVLVGPSGCGKTSTLRMIAGLESVSSGSILIGDRVVNDVESKDRDIAMVFQNYALYPHLTVYKNMAFSLDLRRRALGLTNAQIDQKIRAAATRLGVEGLLDRRPRELSGGQRQRVALGRAIVRSPAVFLFDEPLSNLDAKLRVETRSEIRRLQRSLGTTTIYVTHDQEEAMMLGDRVAVMNNGVLHQYGPPMEVYDAPANRFVAGFLGTPPMNFFDGRLSLSGNVPVFEFGSLRLPLPIGGETPPTTSNPASATLGIRPETVWVGGDERPGMASVAATVSSVEPLGDRKDVRMTLDGGARLVARVEGRMPVHEGENVMLRIDMNRAHVFEPGWSGRRLSTANHGVGASA